MLVSGALVYGLWQAPVRISHVVVYGADQSLASLATVAMQGTYFGLIPRDSTFFFPEASIRTNLLAAYPAIAAVSIFRTGLTGLSIKVDTRVPIARWCGATPPIASSTTPIDDASCDVFDASGFVYATSSPSTPVNPFVIYMPLATTSLGTAIGATLPHADSLSGAFDFARQLSTFGSPITMVVFRGDEVDDYFKSGTRVTYVLGDEENAFTALASAQTNFNLADGSVDYVDLRFPGKVYLKSGK